MPASAVPTVQRLHRRREALPQHFSASLHEVIEHRAHQTRSLTRRNSLMARCFLPAKAVACLAMIEGCSRSHWSARWLILIDRGGENKWNIILYINTVLCQDYMDVSLCRNAALADEFGHS